MSTRAIFSLPAFVILMVILFLAKVPFNILLGKLPHSPKDLILHVAAVQSAPIFIAGVVPVGVGYWLMRKQRTLWAFLALAAAVPFCVATLISSLSRS